MVKIMSPSTETIEHCSLTMEQKDVLKVIDDTKYLIEIIRSDLESKSQILKEQRNLLARQHRAMKSYLDCQIIMLKWHVDRLNKIESDMEVNRPREKNPERFRDYLDRTKRRCKHMLDVSDRYCVLFQDELDLKTKDSNSLQRSKSFSERDLNATVEMVPNREALLRPPHEITQNLVKATLNSVGSHLSVLAKTYTRKNSGS